MIEPDSSSSPESIMAMAKSFILEHEMLDASEASSICDPFDHTHRALQAKVASSQLIQLAHAGKFLYPAFQFLLSGEGAAVLGKVNVALDAKGDPWAVASWWYSPSRWLEDLEKPYKMVSDPARLHEVIALAAGEVEDDSCP